MPAENEPWTEDALEYREFPVRYRMPRPISRAYETVCFALGETDQLQRTWWCARVAVRFLSMLRQACCLAYDGALPVNPPSHHDFKIRCDAAPFPVGMGPGIPHTLLMLAGIYSGHYAEKGREAVLGGLSEILFLTHGRLVVVEASGLRVLYGPRMEYVVRHGHPEDLPGRPPVGTVFFLDPRDGRYVTLNPLVTWCREPSEPCGRLYLLRRMEEDAGHYLEEGVPGSPGRIRPLAGRPVAGFWAMPEALRERLASPPVRFRDGLVIGGLHRIWGLIWRGGLSDIYIASRRDTGRPVILKTLETEPMSFDENYRYFVNEERFTREIDHGRVMKSVKIDLESYGTVHEQKWIRRGSLADLVRSNGVLTASSAVDIMIQLLDALEAIHAAGIVHNDIKPDNILIDDDGSIHVIDFGIACRPGADRRRLRPGTQPGSKGYTAPELRDGEPPSIASDLFSAGVVMSQMLSGRLLSSPGDVRAAREILFPFREFLDRCLDRDPSCRFSAAREARETLRGIRVWPDVAVTLDIEGTLVDNAYERHPRPGLYPFTRFCLEHFDRVFVYTTLGEKETRSVFEQALRSGLIPGAFIDTYEYVQWSQGADGSLKDLRRCRVPLELNAIVDDSEFLIPEDQRHRWIDIPEYNEARPYDRGLLLARGSLSRLFDIPDLDVY